MNGKPNKAQRALTWVAEKSSLPLTEYLSAAGGDNGGAIDDLVLRSLSSLIQEHQILRDELEKLKREVAAWRTDSGK